MAKERVCFNCAFCSEYYPSLIDACDKDDHQIQNVFNETCESFLEVDE